MVSSTNSVENDGVIFSQKNVKLFIEEVLLADGNLSVTNSVVSFESKDDEKQGMRFAYPQITLHAVCRDTTNFPYECILCMIERRAVDGHNGDDMDMDDGSTCDVRFVPEDSSSLQQIYEAIATGQELHPDPDDEDSEEDMFYGDAEEVQLDDEGQGVLDRLAERIQMPSQQEFMEMVTNNHSNSKDNDMAVEDGQFDDAND